MAAIEKRRRADGTLAYRVRVKFKKHPVQTATFASQREARAWAASMNARIRGKHYFRERVNGERTLAELIDRYCDTVLLGKRNARSQKPQLSWWRRRVGHRALSDITRATITECRDELAGTPHRRGSSRAPATVVRYLAALSHVYTVAIRDWEWAETNPVRLVRKPKEPRGRVRFLSDDERRRLLEVCRSSRSSDLYTFVVVALSTGMRRGELLQLRWRHVDLLRSAITLEDTKNGERRRVPLTGPALELLQARAKVRRIDTDLVFPGTGGVRPVELTKAWQRALHNAGIQDFRFHDLRHTAASYLAMNGASMLDIGAILGHKTLAMVKRYAHLSEGHLGEVLGRMNARMFGNDTGSR